MTWKSHGLRVFVNPDLFYLLETLKTEGYWSTKSREAEIYNKNIPFLKHIENILKYNNINFTKRIIVKIKPSNQRFKKKFVKILLNKKEIGFHIERSPFDKSKKIVFQLPYKVKTNVKLLFKHKEIPIKVIVGKEEVNIKCEFKCFGYLCIRFHNAEFIRIIDELSEGKGCYNIKVNSFLHNFPPIFTLFAFSAVIDCEGTIDFYRFFRKIRIRMFNHKYLMEWQKVLLQLGIKSRFDGKEGLCIEGFEDFNKLKELGLKLYHSKKKEKLDKILNSYKKFQVSRNSAIEYYSNKLKEIDRPVTASEFATLTRKSKRVINHHLKRMVEKNLIKINKSNVTWKYFV